MNSIEIDFTFSDVERDSLKSNILKITSNPYQQYRDFESQIEKLIATGFIPERFHQKCIAKFNVDLYENPYFYIKNCPIDDELPFLSFENPVVDKRTLKKTFVAEGFLLLYSKLMKQECIGYLNVNDGDIFQDIHPMQKLQNTQSQKALKPIFFHKDLANHFVRPDWVNILGLRAKKENEIFTSFVRNKDLQNNLTDYMKSVLAQEEFYTPFDDLTVASKNKELGRASNHRILEGQDIRFFENRTEGLTIRAREAIAVLIDLLHRIKIQLLILPGDFIGSANNECIHNKDVRNIGDSEALKNRWLMKTVNVKNLADHYKYIAPNQSRIING